MRRIGAILVIAAAALGPAGCHDREISVTETPIRIVRDEPGRGRIAEPGRVVYVDYEVALPDGEVVIKHQDWRFALGQGAVVAGMDEAVAGMRVGGERTVECPPHKHWGRLGYGEAIPPNTVLTFHIRLNRVD